MSEVVIVCFYWIDSDRADGWEDINESKSIDEYVYTEGILIKELSNCIKISSSVTSSECLSPLRVPYVSIKGGKKGIKRVKKKKINSKI